MKLFVPAETHPDEPRAALDPAAAKKLVDLGLEVSVESGIGRRSGHPDDAYREAGATVVESPSPAASADLVLRVRPPGPDQIASLRPGAVHISFFDPFNRPDLTSAFAAAKVTAISLELVPRSTLAQKMDAQSSQLNLAGYNAVILAASRLDRIFPMLMTPAGTLSPAKVFVIGVAVAGLQAIATAKRLGARVTAFDVRPEALEQAESLGAKALRIDLGQTGSTDQGYATELSAEQLELQRQEQAKVCAASDVVITTARIFGRPAPVLVGKDVVASMRPGSVIIDLAVESGGNVEGAIPGEEVITENGVRIVGQKNLEALVPQHATQMLASNFASMLEHFFDPEKSALAIDLADPIAAGCVVTHDGAVVHPRFQS